MENRHAGTALIIARPVMRIPRPVRRRVGSKGNVSKKMARQITNPTVETRAKESHVQIPRSTRIPRAQARWLSAGALERKGQDRPSRLTLPAKKGRGWTTHAQAHGPRGRPRTKPAQEALPVVRRS